MVSVEIIFNPQIEYQITLVFSALLKHFSSHLTSLEFLLNSNKTNGHHLLLVVVAEIVQVLGLTKSKSALSSLSIDRFLFCA